MPNMIYLTCSDLKIALPNRPEEEVIAVLLLTSYPHLCLKILFVPFLKRKAYRTRKDDGTVTIMVSLIKPFDFQPYCLKVFRECEGKKKPRLHQHGAGVFLSFHTVSSLFIKALEFHIVVLGVTMGETTDSYQHSFPSVFRHSKGTAQLRSIGKTIEVSFLDYWAKLPILLYLSSDKVLLLFTKLFRIQFQAVEPIIATELRVKRGVIRWV